MKKAIFPITPVTPNPLERSVYGLPWMLREENVALVISVMSFIWFLSTDRPLAAFLLVPHVVNLATLIEEVQDYIWPARWQRTPTSLRLVMRGTEIACLFTLWSITLGSIEEEAGYFIPDFALSFLFSWFLTMVYTER